jgi:hypothetical protein
MDSLHYAKASLTSVFRGNFSVSCAPLSILASPSGTAPEPPSIDNGVHGTEKLLLKTQVMKILHSEVNLTMEYTNENDIL